MVENAGIDPATSRHGWVYKIHFESGFVFQFSIFTSFLLFCNFQTCDVN